MRVEKIKKENKKIIDIQESVKIPQEGFDLILEQGDQIHVLKKGRR